MTRNAARQRRKALQVQLGASRQLPDFASQGTLASNAALFASWQSDGHHSKSRKFSASGVALDESQLNRCPPDGCGSIPKKFACLRSIRFRSRRTACFAGLRKRTRLISSDTAGMALRYGIFIRSDCWQTRRLHRA